MWTVQCCYASSSQYETDLASLQMFAVRDGVVVLSSTLQEIARVLSENKADVHVDPLLHRACALDIKHYCFDIPSGQGRRKCRNSSVLSCVE